MKPPGPTRRISGLLTVFLLATALMIPLVAATSEPVRAQEDPNFGYETKGASSVSSDGNTIRGSWFTCPAAGTADSITVYLEYEMYSFPTIKCAIYKRSDWSLVGYTEEWEMTTWWNDWKTFNIISGGALEPGVDYWLVWWSSDQSVSVYYTTETGKGFYRNLTYNSFPDPLTSPNWEDRKYSIYCTYTIAAPPTKPLLHEPTDGATLVDSTPYFEWENGDYAENHRLLVDNDPDFGSPEIDIIITGDNSYTATIELPNDNYKWKVIAQSAVGENESDVWTFLMDAPTAPTAYVPEGPENAAPGMVIRITADLKAISAIENVIATLNIDGAFSFLAGYPENIGMDNFEAGETKTAEWMVATPLTENTYSYNVTWEYEFGSSVTSDNASIDVTSAFVPELFDWAAAAMFVFPLALMGVAFAFDNPVFASFAGVVFILSGVYFVDTIWLALIFVGVGVYLLLTAFLSGED